MPPVHLDTHVALWLAGDDQQRVSPRATAEIEAAESIRISPIVLLEVDVLHEIGRVSEPSTAVLGSLAAQLGVEVCDAPFLRVIGRARDLAWTRDPFDRIIVGQALAAEAPLVTRDRTIRNHLPTAIW